MPAPPGIARTAAAQAAPLPPLAAAGWVASASFQTLFPYPTAARVAADAQIATVLLGPLGVQLPQDMVLRGQADIDITGALAAPDQLRGSGSIRDLVIERGGFAARADSLAASIDESQILINGTVETDGGSVVISPRFDLTTGELGGHLRGRLPASAVHLYNPALIAEGHFELNIELAGTSTAPRLMGSLTASDVLVDADWPYPLHVEAARVEATGDRLHVTDFEGALGNHPLSLTADIALDTITSSTSTAISTLAMTIDGLALQPLLARAPAIESLVNGGSISAALRLEGNGLDPRAWEGEIVLSELGLRMDQYRAELADPIVATLGGGTLSLPPATRLVGGNTDLGLRGDINLDTFAIDLYADGTFGFEALNMLSPYWGTGGVADLDLRVYGDGGNPAYQGFATLRDMVLLPPVIRQPVEDISARLDFEGRRILISDVRGALGGGDVTGNGEVFLRNNYPQSFRLDVRVDGAVIRLERDVRFTASANLVHDGTPDRSLLSGTIDLIETQYGREYDSDRALLEMLDAPETEPNPFLDSINLALALRGTEDIFIDNNLADVEAAADFDVRGTAARPVVLGRASILSGRLFWNGNNFDVLQGTVEFNNPFETEATFEVRSRTEIRRYTIDMRFSGSLTRGVDFDYTSTPTLSDLELFNLLAFGEEPDSTTLQDPDRYQQALGLQATRYLTDAYFSEVESGARRLFGVDRFRISPTISGKETDATARVTLGKRINRNVYLTYSRLLSTSEDQLITVEYQVSPRLRIKGTRDEDGSFGIDFLVQQRIRR